MKENKEMNMIVVFCNSLVKTVDRQIQLRHRAKEGLMQSTVILHESSITALRLSCAMLSLAISAHCESESELNEIMRKLPERFREYADFETVSVEDLERKE